MSLIARADLQSPTLIEIAAYLDSKRAGGLPPRRADMDPVTEIPKLVPYLQLVERTASRRVRYRLVGSIAAEIVGQDLTGRWIDEIATDSRGAAWDIESLFRHDSLLCGVDRPPWSSRAHILVEWVAQRLTTEPGASEIALLGIDYRQEPEPYGA